MKQIPLLQGKALLIELPEGATKADVISRWLEVHRHVDGYGFTTDLIDLPPGNWRIIGMLSEVTEEQAAGIVDDVSFKYQYLFKRKFEDYSCEAENDHDTTIESLESAILAENWYFENPYGEEPTHLEHMRAGWLDNPITDDVRRVWNWKEAQSRVLDRSRCLLLGREDV